MLPEGARVVDGPNPALVSVLGRPSSSSGRSNAVAQGAYTLGEFAIELVLLGLFVYEQRVGDRRPLKVYPSAERLRSVSDRSRHSRLQGTRSRVSARTASSSPTSAVRPRRQAPAGQLARNRAVG